MAGFNWGESKKTFSSNNKDRPKLGDVVDVVEYTDGEYKGFRFIGAPKATATHWINTLGKSKDGKKKKINSFPKQCLGFDPETHEVDASKCPYCSELELAPRIEVLQNAIDRDKQENEPKRPKPLSKFETKFREWNGGKHRVKEGKNKGGYTPVVVVPVGPAIGGPIGEITSLNKHKNKAGDKVAYGPDDPRKGFDVMIKKDSKEPPAKMYQVQKGEIQPLTDEEKEYPIWDIPDHAPEELAEAKKEAKRMKPYLCNRDGELSFPDAKRDDEDGGKKKKKRNQYSDEFNEDEDMEEDADEDDDEDDEDDDDDRPSKKSKSKSKKSKSKSKKRDDDDDDDDEDDDDGEAPWDDDEDDEDEDEDDEDEDESPRKKSKSKSSKTSSKKIKGKSKVSKIKLKRPKK